MSAPSFVVLVPVKPPARGKSRLGALPGSATAVRRAALAEAFVRDTVAAALGTDEVAQVVVVTDDAHLARTLRHERCLLLPDGVSGDLNGTLRLAAAEARRRRPELRPAALCGDLPALTPAALDEALAALLTAAGDGAGFVPDVRRTGTTLYSAPYDTFLPRFGPGSRAAHLADGAVEVADVTTRVRHDVDDADDLERAVALGVGPRTAAVLDD